MEVLDVTEDDDIVTEVNGEWKLCKVLQTDCNIAKVQVINRFLSLRIYLLFVPEFILW